MKIHHLRNATLVIETKDIVLLVDPMLGKKGTAGPPFTLFRFPPKRNPIIDMPAGVEEILTKVTHCLLTHLHPDHLDQEAEKMLRTNNIPVVCSVLDQKILLKRGLNVVQTVNYWESTPFLGGRIEGIPAKHGYGFVAKPMGNVMGYFIQLPKEQSIYISADTIYTKDVEKVLKNYNPGISVVAGGSAQLDIFKPLLMTVEDIIRFVNNAPSKVIINHLEAVNHCPTTRKELGEVLHKKRLLSKVSIPEDGDVMSF